MMEDDDELGEEEESIIDIDNEEDLARRGLKRIQIEGEEEEYLMDEECNIYNLQGNFIGTTNEEDLNMRGREHAMQEDVDA
jgi:hypothetical protein